MNETSTPCAARLRALAAAAALACALAAQTTSPDGDPRNGEVPLPATGGWNAFLVHDAGVGVWTVKSFQVLPQLGCPEIVGLDDAGHCTVLISYSGKWTPRETVRDGQWLAPVAHADVDPRVPGPELYAGGKSGNVYRIVPDGEGDFDTVEIAHFAGQEVHTVVADDLRPERAGAELVVFTIDGEMYELRARGDRGGFDAVRIAELPGRVRDAVVLDAVSGQAPWIATVARAQEVALLRLRGEEVERRVILREPMGFGRIARGASRPGGPAVLYVTRDDGLVLRLEEDRGGTWLREVVYAGPQGLRGLVAGRFSDDPEEETLAVFGYSAKVQLLRRHPGGPWRAETLFVDRDRGHWLATAEVDGRNSTDEIIASGYSGRIVLLARPPGYGLGDVTTDPDARKRDAPVAAVPDVPRVAVKAGPIAMEELSPLRYQGGFETKTAVYETLVRRDAKGHLAPGLAESWRMEDGGRVVVFTLREGATFHDGTPVTAEAVVTHFRRWVGLPEHAWLRSSAHIVGVHAVTPREVRVVMDRSWALLPDLCAINPCAIQGPSALDREGAFVQPVGSGPFRVVGTDADTIRLARHDASGARIDFVRLDKVPSADPLDALLRGEVDAVFESWLVDLDPARIRSLKADSRFQVVDGPGSSVRFLSFARGNGHPTADVRLRRRIAASIDRAALCAEVEGGLADPCLAWAAPSVTDWPQIGAPSVVAAASGDGPALDRPLRLAATGELTAAARAVARQLAAAGLEVVVGGDGDPDVRFETTWGVPYDPYLSLVARFAPPLERASAASDRALDVDPRVRALVEEAMTTPGEDERRAVYGRIQRLLDEEVLIVPLYAPRRAAVVRAGLPPPPVPGHDLYRTDLTFLTSGH